MPLELVVPTYNKPKIVQYIIDEYNKQLEKVDFVLSVHDSSETNVIFDIISKSKFFKKKIFYYHYDSNIRLDEKVLIGLTKNNYAYKMLCGDGWVVDVSAIYSSNILKYDYNVICNYEKEVSLYHNYYKTKINVSRTDKQKFLYDNFWYLIMFGSSILSNEITKKINVDAMIERFYVDGFAYPATLAMVCDDNNIVTNYHFISYNPYKVVNTWLNKTILLWCYNITITFDQIPDVILNQKYNILKKIGKYTKILTFRGFIHLKINNAFDFSIYKKYRKYILQTKGCSILSLMLVLLIPNNILKFIKKIKK